MLRIAGAALLLYEGVGTLINLKMAQPEPTVVASVAGRILVILFFIGAIGLTVSASRKR